MGICRFIVVGESDGESGSTLQRGPIGVAMRASSSSSIAMGKAGADDLGAELRRNAKQTALLSPVRPRRWPSAARALELVDANYLVGQFVFGDMSLAESLKSNRALRRSRDTRTRKRGVTAKLLRSTGRYGSISYAIGEERDRFEAFGQRHIAEHELPDEVIRINQF